MSISTLKPIETIYNGYRFRSRLEARWAVFFDALGVKYEYEPEGFRNADGKTYLPDFRIKCYGTRGGCGEDFFDLYVEVKGNMTADDAEKIKEFSCYGDCYDFEHKNGIPILVVGEIPNYEHYDEQSCDLGCYKPMGESDVYPWNYRTIDGDTFAAYPAVKDGHFYLDGDDSNYMTADLDTIRSAFRKARQARFEHGEMP